MEASVKSKGWKDTIFSSLQKLGGSMMIPIAMLPAAGLLLGLGMALSNPQLLEIAPFMANGVWPTVSNLLTSAGNAIFANLAVIFAVGVAVGLAEDGSAGLAALVGFFMMNQTIKVILNVTPEKVAEESTKFGNVLGIDTLQTGVFGGILIGVVAYQMYKKFHGIILPQYLGFFQAKRFVPIATSVAAILVGVVLSFIWPIIQVGVFDLMSSVLSSNNPSIFAVFIYGMIFKFLGLFGLHHLVYPIYYYQLGSYTNTAGQVIQGDQAIYFAQLSDGAPVTAGASMSGSFIIYMIGLLGVALAIYKTAKPENKKATLGIISAAALTASITGITEPLEFAFAFAAFPLYVVHSIITGIGYAIAPALGIHVGTSFSGGVIDFILCSVIPNAPRWWLVIPVGIVFAVVYYFLFTFLIKKFDFKTPGREDAALESSEEVFDLDISDKDALSMQIIDGLGGKDYIETVNACFTRLRVALSDTSVVKDDYFKKLGASSVFRVGNGVQIVFGTQSAVLKDEINKILKGSN